MPNGLRREITKSVKNPPLTTDPQVQSRISPFGICVEQSNRGFPPNENSLYSRTG